MHIERLIDEYFSKKDQIRLNKFYNEWDFFDFWTARDQNYNLAFILYEYSKFRKHPNVIFNIQKSTSKKEIFPLLNAHSNEKIKLILKNINLLLLVNFAINLFNNLLTEGKSPNSFNLNSLNFIGYNLLLKIENQTLSDLSLVYEEVINLLPPDFLRPVNKYNLFLNPHSNELICNKLLGLKGNFKLSR